MLKINVQRSMDNGEPYFSLTVENMPLGNIKELSNLPTLVVEQYIARLKLECGKLRDGAENAIRSKYLHSE